MVGKSLLRYSVLFFVFLAHSGSLAGEGGPKVPSQMDFGGMKLKITDAARAEIQQQVDALRVSEKYFRMKLDRVLLYFPIIEEILKEENMPDDIKYLVIQESGLVSDAVSSSNAVGFWMFKEPAGREVGLRIDKYVDERLNIVASTRGACKYIKRHNFFFDNWVYSVIAHNTGKAGAERHVNKSNFGASKMTIDKDTHWYFKTFLAHKIAFQDEIGSKPSTGMSLREFREGGGKTLDKIAKEFKVEEELVFQYNKWLQRGPVPSEKPYSVIIPLAAGEKVPLLARKSEERQDISPAENIEQVAENSFPILKEKIDSRIASFIVEVNGIPAIIAGRSDNLKTLSEKSGVEVGKLSKYNEVGPKHKVEAGQVYYLKKKRGRARIFYHTVQTSETLWSISQDYGMKVKRLARKNRMFTIDRPETGRVLWLRKKRPSDVPVEVKAPEMHQQEVIAMKEPEVAEQTGIPYHDPVEEEIGPEPEEKELVANARKDSQTFTALPEEAVEKVLAEDNSVIDDAKVVHVVKKGETIYGIARKYGVTLNELMEWNQLNRNSVLSIGHELHLVERDTSNVKEVLNPAVNTHPAIDFHIVAHGDTMYSISRKYNVSLEQLMKMNNKTNFILSVGEKLKISD